MELDRSGRPADTLGGVRIPPELFHRLAEAFRHIRDIDRFLELLAASIRDSIDVREVRIRAAPGAGAIEGVTERHGELRIDDSEFCIPLALRGRTLGTLHLLPHDEGAPFHPQDLFLLTALSDFVASVMDHAVAAAPDRQGRREPSAAEAGPVGDDGAGDRPVIVVLHPSDPVATALKWVLQPEFRILVSQTADDLYQRLRLQRLDAVILPMDLYLPPAADVVAAAIDMAPGLLIIGMAPPGNGRLPVPPGVHAVFQGTSDVANIRSVVLDALERRPENRR